MGASLLQHQLEEALLGLGQFQSQLEELLEWLGHTTEQLRDRPPRCLDLQSCEIELAKHKARHWPRGGEGGRPPPGSPTHPAGPPQLQVLQKDVLSRSRTMRSVMEAGEGLLLSSGGEDGLQGSLRELRQGWDFVLAEMAGRQLELENNLSQVTLSRGSRQVLCLSRPPSWSPHWSCSLETPPGLWQRQPSSWTLRHCVPHDAGWELLSTETPLQWPMLGMSSVARGPASPFCPRRPAGGGPSLVSLVLWLPLAGAGHHHGDLRVAPVAGTGGGAALLLQAHLGPPRDCQGHAGSTPGELWSFSSGLLLHAVGQPSCLEAQAFSRGCLLAYWIMASEYGGPLA